MPSAHGSTCSVEQQTAPFGKPKVAKHSKPPGEDRFSDDKKNISSKYYKNVLVVDSCFFSSDLT